MRLRWLSRPFGTWLVGCFRPSRAAQLRQTALTIQHELLILIPIDQSNAIRFERVRGGILERVLRR
jgi:hypothetical protein